MRRLLARQVDYSGVPDGILSVTDGNAGTDPPNINALADVDTSSQPPGDGDALMFDEASGMWKPGAGGGGGGSAGSSLTATNIPLLPGRFYQSQISTQLTTVSQLSGRLLVTPFWAFAPVTIDALATDVSAGSAGCSVALGIYNTDTYGRPTTLRLSAAAVDASTSGAKVSAITAAVLPAGLHWLAALWLGGTFSLRAHSNISNYVTNATLGFATANDTSNPILGYDYPNGYSALPASLPIQAPNGTGVRPRVMIRAA